MKDARRQMRRAMGEEAVKQVEGQTEVLGLHHQRLESLRDISIGLDRELAKLHGSLEGLRDEHNQRISALVRRVDKLERQTSDLETSLWMRLKCLIHRNKT